MSAISKNEQILEKFANNYTLRNDAKIKVSANDYATAINPVTGEMTVHSFIVENISKFIAESTFAVRHEVGHFNHSYKYWGYFQDFLIREGGSLREAVIRRLDDIYEDSKEQERDGVLQLWFAKTIKAFIENAPEAFLTTVWENQVIMHLYMMANNAPKELLWNQDCVDYILENGLLSIANLAKEINNFAQLKALADEIVARMGGDRKLSATNPQSVNDLGKENNESGKNKNDKSKNDAADTDAGNEDGDEGDATSNDSGSNDDQSSEPQKNENADDNNDASSGKGNKNKNNENNKSNDGNGGGKSGLSKKSKELIKKINKFRAEEIKKAEEKMKKNADKMVSNKAPKTKMSQKDIYRIKKEIEKTISEAVKKMRNNRIVENSNNGFSIEEVVKIIAGQTNIDFIEKIIEETKNDINYAQKVYEIFKSWFKIDVNKTNGRLNAKKINRLLSSRPDIFSNTRYDMPNSKFDFYCLIDVSGSMDGQKTRGTTSILGHFLKMFQELILRHSYAQQIIRFGVGTFSDKYKSIYRLSGDHITKSVFDKIVDKYARCDNRGGGTSILRGITNSVDEIKNVGVDQTRHRLLLVITDGEFDNSEFMSSFELCRKNGISLCWICLNDADRCPIYGIDNDGKKLYEKFVEPYIISLKTIGNKSNDVFEEKFKKVFYHTVYDTIQGKNVVKRGGII
jgi:uncharacterized protein with von Willebrand factor type A (vWA) domain